MKKIYLILFLTIIIISGCQQETQTEQEEILTSVEVIESKLESINLITTFTGRVQSKNTTPVMVQTPGEVEKVYVSDDEYVQKDQKLFSIVSTNNLRQLQQAQAAYDSAYANYLSAKEQVELAKENYEKTKKLYEAGAVSKNQLEQAELSASEQPLKAAQAAVDQAKISLESAEESYSDTVVRAPVSGIVTGVTVEENSFVTNTQATLFINDNSQYNINLSVTEKYVNRINENDQVGIKVAAIESNYDGIVEEVSSSIDTNSLLYPVTIRFSKTDEKIKSGMIAQVEIITESKKEAIVIPAEAVLLRGDKEIVFINDEGVALQKEVVTGIDNGEKIEVIEGLETGEVVIFVGQNFLSSGDKIKVVRGD
ncbi:MAG: efflux RND transporter periplasmic adaptor subunit [Clostridia bacterium]